MDSFNPFNFVPVTLKGVKLSTKPFDPISPSDYPYALLLAQLRPQFIIGPPGLPLRQDDSDDNYRNKIYKLIKFAMKPREHPRSVHFCVLPELSLPWQWIKDIRKLIEEQKPSPHTIFCLPLEHLEYKYLNQVLVDAKVSPDDMNEYQNEFHGCPENGMLNLCWICARAEDGVFNSHFQAKFYPALPEGAPRWQIHRFYGGRTLRLFQTDDDPPLGFAVLICFDFIAGGEGKPSPLKELIKNKSEHNLNLDWLFVPQLNPKPLHPDFNDILDDFYKDHTLSPASTAVIWINAAGNFPHPLSNQGPYGGSALAGRLPHYDTAITKNRNVPPPQGSLTKLSLSIEEEVVCLYADKLPAQKFRGKIGEGREFQLEFYYFTPASPTTPLELTRIKDPQNPPWTPSFYRSHFQLLQALEVMRGQDLKRDVTHILGELVKYVPLKLEKGVLPPMPRSQKDKEKDRAFQRKWEPFRAENLLSIRDKFLLIGDVGSGKTTLLHWLGREISAHSQRIPFYLNLRDLGHNVTYGELKRHFGDELGAYLSIGWENSFDKLCDQGSITFLLDSLDQTPVSNYEDFVGKLIKAVKKNGLVIATRPSLARHLEDFPELVFLRLRSFDDADQRAYFGSKYKDAQEICALAPDLTRVPMLAYLVMRLLVVGEKPQKAKRTELYRDFIEYVLFKHIKQSQVVNADRVHRILKALAFYSLAAEPPQLGLAQYDIFEEYNEGQVRENELLSFGLVNSLVERDQGDKPRLFFTHQSFQEFLAAQYAWEHPEKKEQVLSQMCQPQWREVLKFLVGMDSTGEILKRIYPGPKTDNVIHSRLFLAAACLPQDPREETEFARDLLEQLKGLALDNVFRKPAIESLVVINSEPSRDVIDELLDNHLREILEALKDIPEPIPVELVPFVARHLEVNSDLALAILACLGERLPKEVIQDITRLVDNNDKWVRVKTIEFLASLGEQMLPLLNSALSKILEDQDNDVGKVALRILTNVGKKLGLEYIPDLARVLADDHRDQIKLVVPEWQETILFLEMLLHQGFYNRIPLWQKEDGRVLDYSYHFREILHEGRKALVSLWKLMPQGLYAVLAQGLDHKEDYIRVRSIKAISLMDAWLPEMFQALSQCLKDNDSWVKGEAIKAFSTRGAWLDLRLIPALASGLKYEDADVRAAAIKALSRYGRLLPEEQIPIIANFLQDDHDDVCVAATWAIYVLKERVPRELFWAIVHRLENRKGGIPKDALIYLYWMEEYLPPDWIPSIKSFRINDFYWHYLTAVDALVSLGKRNVDELISSLDQCLKKEYQNFRRLFMRRSPKEIFEGFESADLRGIISSLAHSGNRLPPGMYQVFFQFVEEDDGPVCAAALNALAEMEKHIPREHAYVFAKKLKHPHQMAREAAAKILARMGERLPGELIPALFELLDDSGDIIAVPAIEVFKALPQFANHLTDKMISQIAQRLKKRILKYADNRIYALRCLQKLAEIDERIWNPRIAG